MSHPEYEVDVERVAEDGKFLFTVALRHSPTGELIPQFGVRMSLKALTKLMTPFAVALMDVPIETSGLKNFLENLEPKVTDDTPSESG